MVGYSFGNSGKNVNAEYHAMREKARTETYGLFQWGDIDIEKFDLDTVEFDRAQKDSTHITENRVEVEGGAKGGVDIRKFPSLSYSTE
jgi:hypothetical protein